jgi:hypothetical protein
MEQRTDFLYASLGDIQGTIRAIDVRIGFLLILLFAPMAVIDKIVDGYSDLIGFNILLKLVSILDIAAWLLAMLFLFLSVSAISNPANHVRGKDKLGSFYGGGLFPISIVDAIYNRNIESVRTVEDEISTLPQSEDEIISSLTYERMKLIYIRDIKMRRFSVGLSASAIWVVFGLILLAAKALI